MAGSQIPPDYTASMWPGCEFLVTQRMISFRILMVSDRWGANSLKYTGLGQTVWPLRLDHKFLENETGPLRFVK